MSLSQLAISCVEVFGARFGEPAPEHMDCAPPTSGGGASGGGASGGGASGDGASGGVASGGVASGGFALCSVWKARATC